MAAGERPPVRPRHYFLNERHQLRPGTPTGGGAFRPFRVDWPTRSTELVRGLRTVHLRARETLDPTRDKRFFLLAVPDASLQRMSDAADAVDGAVPVRPSFLGEDARVLQRLGLDLLKVDDDGAAVVHADANMLAELTATALLLEELPERERARWARIGEIRPVDVRRKVDAPFLERLARGSGEAIVLAHIVLTDLEGARLGDALKEFLGPRRGRIETRGRDTQGGHWFRVVVDRQAAEGIAASFDSVRLIHPPIVSRLAAPEIAVVQSPLPAAARPPGALAAGAQKRPRVAVVDAGVEENHPQLGPYLAPEKVGEYSVVVGTHGTAVASRVIWGDLPAWPAVTPPVAACDVVDVRVATSDGLVDVARVLDSMKAVALTNLARIYNLSIGDDKPWHSPADEPAWIEGRLLRTAELDQFAFDHDAIVVVAAGNTVEGVSKEKYPKHLKDPQWGLDFWSCGVNTLVCGSSAPADHPCGMAKAGEPSPFTRVGFGIAESRQPLLSAPGGNWNKAWKYEPGLGVMGASATSINWEAFWGTSFAAPVISHQAARTLDTLSSYCPPGSRVRAGLVKAYLVRSASRRKLRASAERLAVKALGRGTPDAGRLREAVDSGALLFWQGVIPAEKVEVRVRFPIPGAWIAASDAPKLRVVASWNTPVVDTVRHIWAAREVDLGIAPSVNDGRRPLKGPRNPSEHRLPAHGPRLGALPLIDRIYDLTRLKTAARSPLDADTCILSLSYRTVVEPGQFVNPEQPVGVLLELFDDGPVHHSPHESLVAWEQSVALPLDRLAAADIAVPVRIPKS